MHIQVPHITYLSPQEREQSRLCGIIVWKEMRFWASANEVIRPRSERVDKSGYDKNFAKLVEMVTLGFGGLIVDMMLQCLEHSQVLLYLSPPLPHSSPCPLLLSQSVQHDICLMGFRFQCSMTPSVILDCQLHYTFPALIHKGSHANKMLVFHWRASDPLLSVFHPSISSNLHVMKMS